MRVSSSFHPNDDDVKLTGQTYLGVGKDDIVCFGFWLGSIAHYDYSHANAAEVIGLGSVHCVSTNSGCGWSLAVVWNLHQHFFWLSQTLYTCTCTCVLKQVAQ